MRVLVTGASGFVGRAVVQRIVAERGLQARAAHRGGPFASDPAIEHVAVPAGLSRGTDWREALAGCEAVVHCAARVHVMRETAADPLAEFRATNVEGTLRLARQAAEQGVRRFVFLSSIKVNGERTSPERPYSAADVPAPVDPYGISKREAEDGLREIARETELEVAIIRPVLVYGPGVKGNFRSLLGWLHRGIPLPLGAVHNRRSLVALENLVDLVVVALRHPAAAGGTFLVSDGDDMSTTELLRRAAAALGVRARLVPVPAPVLRVPARLVGKGAVAERLLGSLTVDIGPTRERLGWSPPIPVRDALERTARDFLARTT